MKERITRVLGKAFSARETIILMTTVGLVVLFHFTSFQNKFLTAAVQDTIFTVAPELGIIVIGVTLLMIAGEFDLSVGSGSAFCALIIVELYGLGVDPFLGLVIVLCVGLGLGAINGLATVKFGIPSFIVTLGMMMAWRGVIYVATAGSTLRFKVTKTDPAFYHLLVGKVGGIPIQVFWFVIITAVFALILNYHRFGNRVYSTGGNKEAAKAMGIKTDQIKVFCFLLVGLLFSFAGVMRATRVRGFYAQQGDGMELMAIAAAVVGGTSLFGGTGTIIGAFLGVLVITFLEYGLIISRVPGFWFRAVLGILIVTVAVVNKLMERRRGLS
jgi:simple sugar transport system permease protein